MDSKMDSKIDSDFDNNFDNNDSIELISSSIRIRSESEELMINQNNPNVNIRTIDNVDIIPEKKNNFISRIRFKICFTYFNSYYLIVSCRTFTLL